VKPKLSENRFGDTEIIYESLTAQDLLQKKLLALKPLSDLNIFRQFYVFDASKVCDLR